MVDVSIPVTDEGLAELPAPSIDTAPAKEIVFWYNAPGRPRRALIPVPEIRKLAPDSARYAHDNSRIKVLWTVVTVAAFAFLGLLVGAAFTFNQISQGIVTSQVLVVMMTPTSLLGMAGFVVGKEIVTPRFMVPPMWFIRVIDGEVRPITIDEEWPKKVQRYVLSIRAALQQRLGDDRPDTLIPGPAQSGEPTARWDARALFDLEDMRDERLHVQGWSARDRMTQVVKIGGLMAIGILAVIVFSIIIANESQGAATSAAMVLT